MRPRVLVFGTSISEGQSSEKMFTYYLPKQRWTALLRNNVRTIVDAKTGRAMVYEQNMHRTFSEFQEFIRLKGKDALCIIVELGLWDFYNFTQVGDFIRTLNTYIDYAKAQRLKVVYMNHCGCDYSRTGRPQQGSLQQEFNQRLNLVHCPVLDLRPWKDSLLGSDGVHYSLAAQPLLAKIVLDFLGQHMNLEPIEEFEESQ